MKTTKMKTIKNIAKRAAGLFLMIICLPILTGINSSFAQVTWTTQVSGLDNQWRSVTYGNGLFVAVASSGTGNRVMTSPDGITWTIRSSAADNNWYSVTYGNGLFVAVAESGTGNRVMTSPDGITWTIRTSAADNWWYSVTYGNGLFVAVAGSGTGNRVMTSPDGITWTIRSSAADNAWNFVTYGNGVFVAVAVSGTGNRVMTSPDGITWTIRSSAANNVWTSVTYGNGLFVAVSLNGIGNRVMTSGAICTDPAVPTLSASASTICPSGSTTLSIATGTLNNATNWQWYSASCGGTSVGSGTSIVVSPTVTTTYYARGEGGCVVSGVCANITITVNSAPTIFVNSGTICSGESFTMVPSGANTYTYSSGTAIVSPTANAMYSVSGTNSDGCVSLVDAIASITVNACITGTAITTVPCGLTISNQNTTVNAASVTGATQYCFKFYNNTTNELVATKIQPSRTITFNTVNGIYYGNTYKWTVAVDQGSGFGPESNSSCLITFAVPKSSVPCGNSYLNLKLYAFCPLISKATNYRFSFYDNSTNSLLAVKTQTSHIIYFNTVPELGYGKTYKWTVEVQYNDGTGNLIYGPASSNSCTVSFNAPQSSVPCGNSYSNLNSYALCKTVSNATNYRFSFYDNSTNTLLAVKTQTSHIIYFNTVSGLQYGKTYKWTVEVEYNDGVGNLVYGPASSNSCTVTFNAPQSSVPCGNSYSNLNTYAVCQTASGATNYRFSFYDISTNSLLAVKTQTSHIIYFNTVAGLAFNNSYNWTVEVEYFNGTSNVFGAASSNVCAITYGVPLIIIDDTDTYNGYARLSKESIASDEQLLINLFPNPTKDKITVEASEAINNIIVSNISGQLLFIVKETNEVDLKSFEAGLYIITIETENNTKHFKIIKE